jgi:hypothetical protein
MAFCQHDILPTWHFANMTFCQHDILPTWHFANLQFANWRFPIITFRRHDMT